ncbi:MAG: hypothetical protein ABSG31_04605 [Tepidisphaeraceae bacterium]
MWIFIITLAILFPLRMLWGYLAHRALQNEIAAIRARGEPIDMPDFDVPSIPDSDNAVFYYLQAANSVVRFSELDKAFPHAVPTNADIQTLTLLVDSNQSALNLIYEGAQRRQAAWETSLAKPHARPIPYSHLVQLLTATLFVDYAHQDNEGLIETINDSLRLADALDAPRTEELRIIIAIHLRCRAASIAIALAQRGDVSGPNQARELIRLFLEQQDSDAALARAVELDRAMWFRNYSDIITDPELSFLQTPLVARPVDEQGEAEILSQMSRQLDALSQSNWPAAQARESRLDDDAQTGALAQYIYPDRRIPSVYNAVAKRHFASILYCQSAGIALALRLYRDEHTGKWPDSLNELVPHYLAVIPTDFFSPSGAPIGYDSNAPSGPILHSVGADGVRQILEGFEQNPPAKTTGSDVVIPLTVPRSPSDATGK